MYTLYMCIVQHSIMMKTMHESLMVFSFYLFSFSPPHYRAGHWALDAESARSIGARRGTRTPILIYVYTLLFSACHWLCASRLSGKCLGSAFVWEGEGNCCSVLGMDSQMTRVSGSVRRRQRRMNIYVFTYVYTDSLASGSCLLLLRFF